METLIIGRPNVGKTLFTLNFARYLGVNEVRYEWTDPDGPTRWKKMTVEEARAKWVSPMAHRVIRPAALNWTAHGVHLRMLDSAGIPEGIHPDPQVRRAVSASIEAMWSAQIIFLVMDAARLRRSPAYLGGLDDELVRLASDLGSSVILANKTDQDPTGEGIRRIRRRYPDSRVIEMSALTRKGFREVKQYLLASLAQ